ncbi:hypothetical protein Hanom_Chr04g00314881 [Helianthus anomalus]
MCEQQNYFLQDVTANSYHLKRVVNSFKSKKHNTHHTFQQSRPSLSSLSAIT